MKKIFYGFLALAGLAMVSCSQEIDEQINANTDSVKKVFTANTEDGASTRTSIALEEETGNYVVIWNGDEKIAVNGVDYKVIEGAGTKSVTFGADVEGTEAATAEVYNAVYPNNAWVEGGLDLEHLKEQNALNATYGHGYAVTVATTTDKEMDFKFKNALSFLRVRFSLADDAKEDAITIKTVKITADDNLWGTVSDVDYATGEIGAVANDSELGKSIVYTADEDVVLDRAENAIFDAVIAVPVNEAGRTLTIEITGENAWTGTPYTYKAEGVTKKYLRNNVTTLAKAIKPVEVEFVTEGVYKKADNAYYVTTPEGFLYAGEQMTAGKWNGATIDLVSGAEYDFAGLDFTPINANGITLNGNNATFKNITIKNSTLPYDAIFNIFYGNIYNLKVVDFNAAEADNNRAGVIGGYFTEGVIDNVDVDGAVISGFQKVAGLLSYVTCDRGNVTVKNCDVKNVTINAVADGLYQAGGLVGYLTNARYTVNFEKNTVDALTINNATGWAEGETDADFVQFYSHAFVGSMSQKPTTEADAATSFVIFTDNTIGTVTANPALSVSPRGNEFFGDRRANGFTYQKNTYLGTVIVNGVTLPNRINVVLENLQAAIEAAEDGTTVTLAEDLTLGADEAVVIAADQNITLDLTGKNITIEAGRTAPEPIQNYGTLNIVGGTIVGAESEMSKDIITNNGTMTISGVTISQNYNVGAAIANSGNLTIDGDENEFTTIAATVRNEEGSDAVLTINGGKFVQTGTYADNGTLKYNVDARGGEVIIKGGEFTSNNGVLNVMCEMTIDGGKFYNRVENVTTRHLAYLSTNANLTVNGGEFEGYANPSAGGAFFCLASASAKLVLNDGYFASYWLSGNANRVVELYAAGATYEINGGYYSNNIVSGPHYANNTDEATKDKYPYVVKGVVASVDGVEYSELSAALEAAASSSSKTVNVAAGEHEISGDIAEGLTIVGVMDGEDYLTTIQMPDVLNAENVTIKDMKITQPLAGNHDVDKKVSAIRLNGCGTFENCYIEGYNAFYMGYSLYDMTGDVYFKDCVLKATWAYCISTGGTGNVYIEGCDLYGWNSFSKTGKVTITNSTINSNGTYCKLRFYDAAEVTGSTLADDVSIDFMNYPSTTSVDGKEITFTGNTFNGNLIDAVDTSCFASASPIFTIDGVQYVGTDAQLEAALAQDVENLNICLVPGTYNFGGLSIAPATVTIKGTDKAGVVINMNESIYLSGKTVNFENLTYTVPADLAYTEQAFAFVHHAAGFNFDNCVINRLRLNVASATIKNSTFEVITNSGFDGYGLYYYGNDKSNVKVENCVFNTTGKAICVYSESAKEYNLTVNDTQFYSSNTSTDKAAVSIHAEYGIYGTLTMNRCEATGFIANNNGLWRELNNNTKVDTKNFTKVIDGVVIEDITGGFSASADGEVVVW